MNRVEDSIREAEGYIESAESSYENILQKDDKVWNPVVVNCIMAMIKSVDALMLEKRGHTNSDHSKTSRSLQGLYEDGLISDNFKSNVESVRKWVVDEKTAIQYKNKNVSLDDADRALKASKRFLRKTKKELDY
jgi:uncharacterized protein (UPF0332 family)